MTDRKLLEDAAKAAGITGDWCRWHQSYGDEWVEGIDTGAPFLWNPLTDDGDALRLAVKLGLTIQQGASVYVYDNPDFNDTGFTGLEVCELTSKDPFAATRRAITRAAAEIGKAMKS